jgi:putative transposase
MDNDPQRYRRHRFPSEIISDAVWLYYRFCLSFRKLLKGQGSEPRWLITDKLGSCGAAHRKCDALGGARHRATRTIGRFEGVPLRFELS